MKNLISLITIALILILCHGIASAQTKPGKNYPDQPILVAAHGKVIKLDNAGVSYVLKHTRNPTVQNVLLSSPVSIKNNAVADIILSIMEAKK